MAANRVVALGQPAHLRWGEDKAPADCRYDQLEVTPPAELASVFRPAGG